MYTPSYFGVADQAEALDLIRSIGFGTLVTALPSGIQITHVPFLLTSDGRTLRTHIARANPHWKALEDGAPSVVIFQGVQAYVSPDWYETQPSVPTWNYEVAHVHGIARAFHDGDALKQVLSDISDVYEAGRPVPWKTDKLPDDLFDRLVKGIVGIDVTVDRVGAQRKLSQNKKEADRQGVIRGLETEGGPNGAMVAAVMRALETSGNPLEKAI